MTDDQILTTLALFQQGWDPNDIALILTLPVETICDVLAADASEFPDEPLRANRVLH